MTTSEINAKIEEIRQRWANSQVAFDVEWLLTQLQAERQKNAEGNELYRELALEFTNAADKALTLFHKANRLEAENKTLREALEKASCECEWGDGRAYARTVICGRCAALAKDGDK